MEKDWSHRWDTWVAEKPPNTVSASQVRMTAFPVVSDGVSEAGEHAGLLFEDKPQDRLRAAPSQLAYGDRWADESRRVHRLRSGVQRGSRRLRLRQ